MKKVVLIIGCLFSIQNATAVTPEKLTPASIHKIKSYNSVAFSRDEMEKGVEVGYIIGLTVGTTMLRAQMGDPFVTPVLGSTTTGPIPGMLLTDQTTSSQSSEDKKKATFANLVQFVDGNMDNLVRDMSRGEGDVLTTLSGIWGMTEKDKPIFNELAQKGFSDVFTSENVTSQNLLSNLNVLVSKNTKLSTYTLL